jgi:hypothetical protein
MTYEFDVFLSYNSKDYSAVEQIARWLEEKDLKVWLDKWELIPGDSSIGGLEAALKNCGTCAVFIGMFGMGPWQDEERMAALTRFVSDKSRRVIPVLLPGASDKDIPALLATKNWVKFLNGADDEDAIYLLECGIKGIAPRPSLKQESLPVTDEIPPRSGLPAGSHVPHRPNELFTGRVEMFKQLAEALTPNPSPNFQPRKSTRGKRAEIGRGESGVVITQAVTGMGGIGKTQLAVEFAYRYGRYFRGVHWLNLAEPALFESEIADCGRKMFLNANFPEDNFPAQVEMTLQAWKADGPRLIILDNFEDPAAANAVLACLYDPNIRVLVTSRRSDWLPATGVRPIPLDVFSPAESLDFLKRVLDKRKDSDADLNALAERLGHLPLGLELAARYLNYGHPNLSVDEYLAQARQVLEHPSMQNWRKAWHGLTATQHDINLLNTFALSWNELKRHHREHGEHGDSQKDSSVYSVNLSPPLGAVVDELPQNIFLCTGYLAPNAPIPLEIFDGALEISTEICDEALQDLYGLGLLKRGMDINQATPIQA